jgi:hypothetical protein
MWRYVSNDGRGEYSGGDAQTLAEALIAMSELSAERAERYVHLDCVSHSLVARVRDEGVGFVVVPSFAIDGDYDPPEDADAYAFDEVLALEEADQLLIPTRSNCAHCHVPTEGYFANRTPLGGKYFACLTCQRWTEGEPEPLRSIPRSRRSSIAE